MRRPVFQMLLVAHILISGCAPLPPVPPPESAVQQCLVCRHKRDFACLTVTKAPGTPHTQHAGRTYWFCSESCRCAFHKQPLTFIPQ